MARLINQLFLRGVFQRVLRSVQPIVYGTAMKLRTMRNDREAEAVAPFDSRIRFQHVPLKGRDGFLFHRDHDALDQLTANLVLRRRQIDVWIAALKGRLAWCADNNSVMRFLIIPEKHVVYDGKLPRFIRVSPQRAAMQLLAAVEGDLSERTFYPVEALRAASRVKPTFFRTDTHWNGYGAFVAYQALMDSLRPEIALETVGEGELVWKERPYVGDLGVRFTRERGETMITAEPTANYKLAFQNHNFARGAVHVYENERRDLPTCVLFRDSFANFLIPYLMRGFSRLVAVSSLSCHYDLLEQEKPDVVLFVVIERFIATFGMGRTIELPEDALRVPFETFSGTDLGALRPAPPAPDPSPIPAPAEVAVPETTSADPSPEPVASEPAPAGPTPDDPATPPVVDPAEPPPPDPPPLQVGASLEHAPSESPALETSSGGPVPR